MAASLRDLIAKLPRYQEHDVVKLSSMTEYFLVDDVEEALADADPAASSEDEETPCAKRDDSQHCNCWYDGEPCCACGEVGRELQQVEHEIRTVALVEWGLTPASPRYAALLRWAGVIREVLNGGKCVGEGIAASSEGWATWQDELSIAEQIARKAHAEQKDTVTGAPYITHVARVVAQVEGDKVKAVAWLHDVLEDSDYTRAELGRAGISAVVLDAVDLLTREDTGTAVIVRTYAQYIDSIKQSGNQLAIAVKLADLRDHLHPNCPDRLRPRYEAALAVLNVLPTAPIDGRR